MNYVKIKFQSGKRQDAFIGFLKMKAIRYVLPMAERNTVLINDVLFIDNPQLVFDLAFKFGNWYGGGE